MIKVWKTLLNIYVVIWVILFKYESVVPTIMFNTHREPTYLNSLDYYRGLNKTKWRHWHSVNQNNSNTFTFNNDYYLGLLLEDLGISRYMHADTCAAKTGTNAIGL